MANVGQGEIGDPHGVEGILFDPGKDGDSEVPFVGVGPPVMTMKEMRMPYLTVIMAKGIHIDLGHLEVLMTL